MKGKSIYIGTLFIIVVVPMLFYFFGKDGTERVYQHEVAPKEKETSLAIDKKHFKSHLPIVTIDTKGQTVPGTPIYDKHGSHIGNETYEGKDEITVNITIIDEEEGENSLKETPKVKSKALISYRGNSSRNFDKKSYNIELVDDAGEKNPQVVMGMSKHHKWVLNGPCLDRTLIRNYLIYNVAGSIMDYAPNVRFCELFKDGVYQGVYLMVEPITDGEGRIELKDPEQGAKQTSWIVRWDRKSKMYTPIYNFTYYTYLSNVSGLDLRYPGEKNLTKERLQFVEDDISKIEKALYSYDLTDPKKGYRQYLDRESFVQYFIINEFFRNVDAGRFSTFYYKPLRGKVKTVVWDFNNAADNYINYTFEEYGFTLTDSPWFAMLIKDKGFVEHIIFEYHKLRKTYLSEEFLFSMIDDTVDYLGSAVDRNYEVYGYLFDQTKADRLNYLVPVSRNYTSYEESVAQLKQFIKKRGEWLDQNITTLYQYCHDSKNKDQLMK